MTKKKEILRAAAEVVAGKRSKDDAERQLADQLSSAESLWNKLVAQGVRKGAKGRFEATFLVGERTVAKALAAEFGDDGWSAGLKKDGGNARAFRVTVTTRPVVLGLEVVQELAKMMVAAGKDYSCVFTGLRPAVARPWWKFW